MSTRITSATVRVTVLGPRDRADLVVPVEMPASAVAAEYARTSGLAVPPRLSTPAGVPVDADRSMSELGLSHGAVLVAAGAAAGAPADVDARAAGRPVPSRVVVAALLTLATAGAVAAGVLAGVTGEQPARTVCGVVLALCALVVSTPLLPVHADRARALSSAGPGFAAAAGFATTYTRAPGGLPLGIAAASLAAVVAAAVARSCLDEDHDEIVDVWLVAAGFLAVVSVLVLAVGASAVPLLAVVLTAAVVGARLMPYTVVDVPDQALLDIDRLAVTAWSAREQPRGSRRTRSMVRTEAVRDLVRRGQRLVSAGTVVIAVAVCTAGPLLVLAAGRDLSGIGGLVMVGAGAVALSLVARAFRSRLPRLLLRVSAAWLAAFLGLELLRGSSPTWAWSVFAAAAVLAAGVTIAAVSLGHGWRSVWWARMADVAEALGVVVVVAMLPLASGLFDLVRGFTS